MRSKWNGLLTTSSKPTARSSSLSWTRPAAVTATQTIASPSARIASSASTPPISPMRMSRKQMSGRFSATRATAPRPSDAVRTVTPRVVSICDRISRLSATSSATTASTAQPGASATTRVTGVGLAAVSASPSPGGSGRVKAKRLPRPTSVSSSSSPPMIST